jgi:hypothetical protein
MLSFCQLAAAALVLPAVRCRRHAELTGAQVDRRWSCVFGPATRPANDRRRKRFSRSDENAATPDPFDIVKREFCDA